MILRIKPVAFSVLLGFKEQAAVAACLESFALCSAPAVSPSLSTRSSLPRTVAACACSLLLSPVWVLLQVCLPLLQVLWTNLSTYSSHRDCPVSLSPGIFLPRGPCREEGAHGGFELLNIRHPLSWDCLGKGVWAAGLRQEVPRHLTLLRAQSCLWPRSPNQQPPQRNDPALAVLCIAVSALIYFTPPQRAKGWYLGSSFLVLKYVSAGGWNLAALGWPHRSKMMVSVQLPRQHANDESALSF